MEEKVDPDLLEGYQKFRADFRSDQDFFTRIATEVQKPKLLWIGCSDSRVLPEQITNANPGDLFIVRNIANVVPASGDKACSVGAAIEFSVQALGVEGIVVCGHTGCGGVQACANGAGLDQAEFPNLFNWIGRMKPAREQFGDEIEDLNDLVKANVLLQIENLMTYDCVQKRRSEGDFRLYAWIYHMETGKIEAYDTSDKTWNALGAMQQA